MAGYRLSARAKADLLHIARYTQGKWGESQAKRYIADLEACCALMAEQPKLGRRYKTTHPKWRRMERGSHVLFYREGGGSIFVQRLLHKSMLPTSHQL